MDGSTIAVTPYSVTTYIFLHFILSALARFDIHVIIPMSLSKGVNMNVITRFRNKKLGKAFVYSRLVGLTCPSSCVLLGNGCYRERDDKQYGHVTIPSASKNTIVTVEQFKQLLIRAIDKNVPIRIHEGGDFMLNGKIDSQYIKAIKLACKQVLKEKGKLPVMWVYTHVYSSQVSSLKHYGINVYASIHNKKDYQKAYRKGFRLFALVTDIKRSSSGLTREQARQRNTATPKVIYSFGEKFVICPAQRRGTDEVTCCGNHQSIACNLCVKGLANVGFMSH